MSKCAKNKPTTQGTKIPQLGRCFDFSQVFKDPEPEDTSTQSLPEQHRPATPQQEPRSYFLKESRLTPAERERYAKRFK